ncbi:amidohydrolase family protein [Caulobacter sp. KR2-114]|uniref:amidohydrolase family protein n=1 Tax=Caulobacter sp. KR2-114 TaxID=3400912 RepID=UPI003C0DBDB6
MTLPRRRPTRWPVAGLAALAWGLSLGAAQAAPAPVADHHMHIFSPEASRILTIICDRVGPKKCPPEIAKSPSTGDDVVAALDAAGVRRGVLLSTAYFFGSPELKDLHLDVARETRAENQFVVGQAQAHCERLTAFISVNPLLPNAVDEVRHWARAGGAAGLKLHLGNSHFDFRDPAQVRRLAAVFRAAQQGRLAIVIHMQTGAADYGARDVAIFLRQVASQAPTTPIQIAHAAGGGGVDKGELSALTAFADAFARRPAAHRNIFFDLAMVPDEMSNTRKIAAAPADVAALKAQMRRIGLTRFVLGSDWTSGLNLAPYFEDERAALALGDDDWAALAARAAPYLKTPAASCAGGR